MCPHTTKYVSSYILLYVYTYDAHILLQGTKKYSACTPSKRGAYYISVLILLYMCPHTNSYVSSYFSMCPYTTMCVHTTKLVSSYYYVCVLILLCVSSYYYICVVILLYIMSCTSWYYLYHFIQICPHTYIYVSSYYYMHVFVLILPYMCPHTTVYIEREMHRLARSMSFCPHTTIHVSSYYLICVLILRYILYSYLYIYYLKKKTLVNKVWGVISQHLRIARVRIIYIHSQL